VRRRNGGPTIEAADTLEHLVASLLGTGVVNTELSEGGDLIGEMGNRSISRQRS